MFRMGGRSDDGIMSLRPGFQEGDQVKEPGYFQKSGLGILLKGIGDEARKAGAAVYDLGAAPINLGSRFFLGENPGFSGAKFFGLGEEEGIDPDISYFLGVPTKAKTSEMFGEAGTAQASETGTGETTGAGTGGILVLLKQQALIELKNYLIMILKQCTKIYYHYLNQNYQQTMMN